MSWGFYFVLFKLTGLFRIVRSQPILVVGKLYDKLDMYYLILPVRSECSQSVSF